MSAPPVSSRALRTGWAQRIALIALGLGLALVLLEAALQLAAAVNAGVRDRAQPPAAVERADDVYRVLCVGESTTAAFFNVPYPALLQRELNRNDLGRRFEVINAGVPGTHSAELVARLPALLDAHDPAMVILMMGVNDHLYFDDPDASRLPTRVQRLLYHSRVYRLLRLLAQRLAAPRNAPIDAEHRARFDAAVQSLPERILQGGGRELEEPIREVIRMAREASRANPEAGLLGVPQPYLLGYQRAHAWLAAIHRAAGRDAEAVAVFEEAVARHPEARFFHLELARLYAELGQPERAEAHFQQARRLVAQHPLAITRESYRSALDLLRERGIRVVAMQYPMRSIAPLRELVGDATGVLLVDNEAPFHEAVARMGYENVFSDRFAGDFGHWGDVGNRILVENLIESVFEPLFRKR